MSPSEPHAAAAGTPPPRSRPWTIGLLAGGVVAVLAAGAAAGAAGARIAQRWQPRPVMLLQVAPIEQMQAQSPVALKGRVAEIFGNEFVVQDDSGRALVDLGPGAANADAVTKGEIVTVQGRFDRGVIRAQLVVHADGRSDGFGPPPRPDRGPPGPPPPPRDRRPPIAPSPDAPR